MTLHAARRGLVLLVIAAVATLGLGCDSIYYRAMKKIGKEKRDILVSRVKAARASQADAQEEFKSALERFQAIVQVDGGSLEEPILRPLRDRVLFLKHNLNARALGSLTKELDTVRVGVDELVIDMQRSIADADA